MTKFGMSEDKTRVSLAYKGLAVLPREVLKRLNELQVSELDLSHNDLSYPFKHTCPMHRFSSIYVSCIIH